jgi:hypothetical protein
MIKEMTGVCFLFSETGTEGGWWAMQEDDLVTENGKHWRYEGLRYLEEGDDFTVYAGDGSVLFHGVIHQDSTTGAIAHRVLRNGKRVIDQSWKQQVVGGLWVHWVQEGMDPEAWGELFRGNKRCLLKRSDPQELLPPSTEIVRQLVDLIGRKLTAYAGGVRDVRAVDRWIEGCKIRGDGEQRLRFTFQIVSLLVGKEDPKIIRAWLIGLNPELDDRVPIRLMREGDLEKVMPEIMGAARTFLTGG